MPPHDRNRLIIPPSRDLLRVRERHAPSPQRHVGVEGWIRWGLIDRSGREVRGGEQHNLILDTMLDTLGTHNANQALFLTPQNYLLTHFAVGTGSTVPAVTDVSLDNEIARFTTLIANNYTEVGGGAHEYLIERELDFGAGNGVLTEWGISNGSGSNLLVRELFRDGAGDPIAVTKTSDYKLRIAYTFVVTVAPADPVVASFPIAGIGVINGQFNWVAASARNVLSAATQGGWGEGGITNVSGLAKVFASTSAGFASYTSTQGGGSMLGNSGACTPSPYVPGSHTRSVDVFFGTARANDAPIASLVAMNQHAIANNARAGFAFTIDEADRFTKDNLHTLTIEDFLTVTWGRA